MVLIAAERILVWQEWDDVYIAYQPSSTETHVFNETTALILERLKQGPLEALVLKDYTEAALGIGQGELGSDNFAFAVGRLEELGLIESVDELNATQCSSVI